MSTVDLAEHMFFWGLTRYELKRYANLKPGKTWGDFTTAYFKGLRVGAGKSFESLVGLIAEHLDEVVQMRPDAR